MGNTCKNGRLSPLFQKVVADFDKAHPYVWNLNLSTKDFSELETCLSGYIAANGFDSSCLLTDEWALPVMIYLAEWYKRCYQSGNSCNLINFNSEELKKLWLLSGINIRTFVYCDENGNHRWLYSIFVLGGLAVKHELARNDKGKFLKNLCRIFHGEEISIQQIEDNNRATAFQESIRCQHSLYHYMEDILNGKLPFNQDDIKSNNEISSFISAMRSANDEVLKSKFRLEWIYRFSSYSETMSRYLRLWLKPEEVGGGLHQYLRYDRVHLWGMTQPETKKHLLIAISFWRGTTNICEADFEHPLITYCNTGSSETGFLSWGVDHFVTQKHIPTLHFDKILVEGKDDKGNTYLIQEQKVPDFMQVWRISSYGNEWSNTTNNQKETALVFSLDNHLEEFDSFESVFQKAFNDKLYGKSREYGWTYISDHATLIDKFDQPHIFYNRIGYYQIHTKFYNDTIAYINGAFIKHSYLQEEDYGIGSIEEEILPVIFNKEDILIRYFEHKPNSEEIIPTKESVAEKVEYKLSNGIYTTWNNNNSPEWGVLKLRISIQGKAYKYRVAYLPSYDSKTPIKRDFKKQEILFRQLDKEDDIYHDEINLNGTPLQPSIEIKIGTSENTFHINVYRPTLIKEVCIGNEVIKYTTEKVTIPYILKEDLIINDFSESGYCSYPCKHLRSIYPLIGNQRNASLNAWEQGISFTATQLDEHAPKSLLVNFGHPKPTETEKAKITFYKWDYISDLKEVDYSPMTENNTIIFQSLKNINDELVNICPIRKFMPFGYKGNSISKLKCFEIAIEHRLYFFMLTPLERLNIEEYKTEIYEPLIKARNNQLTSKDVQGLKRFAEEFNFKWEDLGVQTDND